MALKILKKLRGIWTQFHMKLAKTIFSLAGRIRHVFWRRQSQQKDVRHQPIVICAAARDEELYLREWIEYHLQLGFDKIYLYDNNDRSAPPLDTLLADFISAGKVDVIDKRGKRGQQMPSYRAFCREHFYDNLWCAFIDIDEFITLEPPYTCIREFLQDVQDHGFSEVFLNWELYGDNNQLYKSSEPVLERFPNPTPHEYLQLYVKSISYLPDVYFIYSPHFAYSVGKACQSDFTPVEQNYSTEKSIFKNAWVRHYFTKTIEEFFEKLLRGGGVGRSVYIEERLEFFYQINERTPEKTALGRKLLREYFPEFQKKHKEIDW